MSKTVLFDIDGTLADLSKRLHHVKNGSRNWDAFFAECGNDTPIEPVCRLARIIRCHPFSIVLVSGRSDVAREATVEWLAKHQIGYDQLLMRKAGDCRADDVIKEEFLDGLLADGHDILFVVDDRQRVVDMWRRRGLTCLQARQWDESAPVAATGLLTIMVGPSGAGKSHWLNSTDASAHGIHPSHVISGDQIRADLCGDFRDQTKNDEVFAALHAVAKTRLLHGLPTVIDATNLRRKDRLAAASLAKDGKVRYVVIDRPEPDKRRDAGWRATLPIDLIAKHAQTFGSQVKDILAGDNQPNVEVIDQRRAV
jgi:predicted kinase